MKPPRGPGVTLGLVLIMLAVTVAAQGVYPAKPIKLIAPFPPGGGTDIFARLVATKLNQTLGWTIVVENKPGAGGSIGVEAATKSAPDGYTLVMGQTSNLAINPSLYSKLAYDPLKDLTPVALVAATPLVLDASPKSTFKSLADMVAAATYILWHPFVGAGAGMDMLALNEVRGEKWLSVHNIYLEYAVDLGIPGLAMFLLLLVGSLKCAGFVQRRTASVPAFRQLFYLGEGLQISLVAFAVAANFSPGGYNLPFYLFAGLAIALKNLYADEASRARVHTA